MQFLLLEVPPAPLSSRIEAALPAIARRLGGAPPRVLRNGPPPPDTWAILLDPRLRASTGELPNALPWLDWSDLARDGSPDPARDRELGLRLERLLRLLLAPGTELRRRTQAYAGRFFHLDLDEVSLPNGAEAALEVLRHPGAAAVLPLTDRGTAILIRQVRHAAGGRIYEVPAGKLDGGESPASCARREIVEEAGVEAGCLHPLGSIWTTPGFTDEVIHLFAATGLRAARQELEPDEVIETEEMPWSTVLRMLASGEIRDGKTVCALFRADQEIRADRLPFKAR
jgi:ADP-ribose pyrophosphatase